MDRRILTVAGISLLFALVVSSIFYQMSLRAGGGSRRQSKSETVGLVVAAQALSVGVQIKPTDLKLTQVARDRAPAGAFQKIEEVVGRPVVSNILLGEPVLAGSSVVDEGRRAAAEQGCMKCHSVDGSRHIGPTWVDLYLRREKLKDGRTVVADEAYLTRSMMDPGADVVAGYQNVMPTFQGRLTPPEAAAIVEYIKSLKSPAVRSGPSEGPAYESIPARK